MSAGTTGQRPLRRELGDLWWLQRRLLANALRRRDARARARLLTILALLLAFLPNATMLSLGLVLLLRGAEPELARRIVSTGFGFLLLLWAAAPLTAQPLLEGLNLPRLLPQPVSFRGLALGSMIGSAAGLLGLLSLPLLLAAVVGATRGPFSALGALVAASMLAALLVSIKAVSTTLYDLLAEDRRLRGLMSLIVFLPLMATYLDQAGVLRGIDSDATPFFSPEAPTTRLAAWLPGGWFARALRAAIEGRGADWALATAALGLAAAIGFALQLRLLRRLHLGEILRVGRRERRWSAAPLREGAALPLLGARASRQLRGLVIKDWTCFRRSPMSLRLAFLPLLLAAVAYALTASGAEDLPDEPLLIGLAMGGFAAFIVSAIGSNAFGLIDHRGVTSLFLSPVPRRLVLLSQALLLGSLALGLAGLVGLGGALGAREPSLLPAALAGGLATWLVLGGTAQISSVVFPIYIDLERGQNQVNQQSFGASLMMMLGGPVLLAPMALPALIAALLAPRWLPGALGLGLLYALLAALLQQGLALRLLASREQRIVASIAEEG